MRENQLLVWICECECAWARVVAIFNSDLFHSVIVCWVCFCPSLVLLELISLTFHSINQFLIHRSGGIKIVDISELGEQQASIGPAFACLPFLFCVSILMYTGGVLFSFCFSSSVSLFAIGSMGDVVLKNCMFLSFPHHL
jgi:hypothetical protein